MTSRILTLILQKKFFIIFTYPFRKLRSYKINKISKKYYKNKKKIFTEIYLKNLWGNTESLSGEGSTLSSTQSLRNNIGYILNKYKIKSIFDCPCGDFNWMYYFLNNQYKKKIIYVGADIVRKLIYRLQNKYPKYKFVTFDLTNDKCPRFDLIIVRDLLIHLSYKDILRVFQNISDSGSKYLLFSNYNVKKNKDILNGNFREINFFKKPFKLKKKDLLYKIYENDNEGYNKEMILVKVKNLKKLFSLNDKI